MLACGSGLLKVVSHYFKEFGKFHTTLHDKNNVGLLHCCFMGGNPLMTRNDLVQRGYGPSELEENTKLEILKILFSEI